jgi:uncharacterized protein (DUF433 family)
MTPTFFRNGTTGPEVSPDKIVRGGYSFITHEQRTCARCGGSGRLSCFNHVEAGICFMCFGDPTKMRWIEAVKNTTYTAERLAKLQAAQEKREATKREKKLAAVRAEVEAQRPLLDRINAIAEEVLVRAKQDDDRERESLASDAGVAIRNGREHGEINLAKWVTEKRVAALETMVAKMREDAAKVAHAPVIIGGKRTIEGTLISTKSVANNFGYRTTYTLKMLLADADGNKYWSTVPAALTYETLERGTRIRVSATVEPSEKDPHFGILKRPTKAELLS